MSLEQQNYADGIEQFIAQCNGIMSGEYHKLPVTEQRDLYEKLAKNFDEPPSPNVDIREVKYKDGATNRKFRVYQPKENASDALIFYIRGGGFVLGSLDTHHVLMADICENTNISVVAPDFRLAPEDQFPAAIDDCYDVLLHVLENNEELGIPTDKVFVCGDSSGANMAVAVCMWLRDRTDIEVDAQVLFNPVLDFSRWKNGGGDAPLLTAGEMEFYTACYAPGDVVLHEHVSPLINGNYANLPPAYIMAAELDSLKQDSLIYAEELRKEGTDVELVVEPGLVHGAIRARNMSTGARQAFERACAKLVQFASA